MSTSKMSLLIDILLSGSDEKVHEHFGEDIDHIQIVTQWTKEQLLAMLEDEEFVKTHAVDPRISPENFTLWLKFTEKYPIKN